jgi:hypothetical protein
VKQGSNRVKPRTPSQRWERTTFNISESSKGNLTA